MNWIVITTMLAFWIYLSYNFAALSLFNVPQSLSNTYYLYRDRKRWQRLLFPIMMISMAFLLMPAWIEMSEGSNFQFLSFLAGAAIVFTGAAPNFYSSPLENAVHSTSAIVAAICSLLWIILVAKLWYFILIWVVMILLIALLTKSLKSSFIYWLETIAFMSTFFSVLAHYTILS